MNATNLLRCDPSDWRIQYIEDPFELYKINEVFTNGADLAGLKNELENKLKFFRKANDIFSFSGTDDFSNIKNLKRLPYLKSFLNFLDFFRSFLCRKFNVELNTKVSVSCSKYSEGDYLLCHDDKHEDRYIAFIFYLNPTWSTEWGGSLDLFHHDNNKQPSELAYSFYPECNSLIFFKVGDDTHHQVSEVVKKGSSRITINGWYHSRECLTSESNSFIECCINSYIERSINFTNTRYSAALVYLHSFVNFEFLRDEYTNLIVENIDKNGEITLSDFFKPSIFDTLSKEAKSEHIIWRKIGPANRRHYYTAEISSVPVLLGSLIAFFQSKYAISYFESITDYELHNTKGEGLNGAVHVELQRWKNGCYSLFSDDDAFMRSAYLDVLIFLNVSEKKCIENGENITESSEGNIYIYRKNESAKEIEPHNNIICLIGKKKSESFIVPYIGKDSQIGYDVLRLFYKMW